MTLNLRYIEKKILMKKTFDVILLFLMSLIFTSCFSAKTKQVTILETHSLFPDVRSYLPVEGTLRIIKSERIDLDGDGNKEILITSRNISKKMDDQYFSYVDVIARHQEHGWRNVFHEEIGLDCDFNMATGAIGAEGTAQVLFVKWCGSAQYMDYVLMGYSGSGMLDVHISGGGVFGADVNFQGKYLVVGDSWVYRWSNNKYEKMVYNWQPGDETIIASYWWEGDDPLTDTVENTVKISVGQSIYLRRDKEKDTISGNLRTLLSCSREDVLLSREVPVLVFDGVKPGMCEVSIQLSYEKEHPRPIIMRIIVE